MVAIGYARNSVLRVSLQAPSRRGGRGMNGFVSAASTALFVAGAPIFGMLAGRNSPPQPFDDKVVLQGKVPETRKSIASAWVFQYQLDDARLESGPSNLLSNLTLTLNEDGTYRLMYVARWNVPNLDGRNVVENGHFSLSGEILLLEPDGTSYVEVKGNKAAPAQPIANE